jgi:tetratricopeptide (TPR) repeat protein
MRITQELLEKNVLEKDDKIKTVWFDAWKFDKTYDLRVALIHAILRRMKEDESATKELKDKLGELLKRVNWLGLGKAALSSFFPLLTISQGKEPLLKNQEEIPGKTLELIGDFEAEFKELTNEYVGDEGRLVVFIDDLDRCISEKTVDIIEAIKLFLNVPLSVFVIGADKKRIEEGIIARYGKKSEGWAGNYLEKVIQIPFTLPPLIKGPITEHFIQGLHIFGEEEYATILTEVDDNPRRIKRLLNSFEVKRILAEKEGAPRVEENIITKLAIIELRWPDFYSDLISIYSETKTSLTQILKEISRSNEVEREKKLKEWENLKRYFEDKRLMDFLDKEPSLWELDLDPHVYLARRSAELKKSAVNYFNIAYLFGEKGEHVKAIENYEKAIELNPNYEVAWYAKGNEHDKLESPGEAIACYDNALRIKPNYEKAWYNKGVDLGKLERHEEALKCYAKALELNPNDGAAWYNKARTLNKVGRTDEASLCFQKVDDLGYKGS